MQAFYPAKYEAKKSVENALEKISRQRAVEQETYNDPSSIVESFYSNPILSRFCEQLKDDDDVGLQVLGTAGFGSTFDSNKKEEEKKSRRSDVGQSADVHTTEKEKVEEILQRVENLDAIPASQDGERAKAPKHRKEVQKPWVGDFGHLESFPRFPKQRRSDGKKEKEEVSTASNMRGDNILFDMAFDSKSAREQREEKVLFDEVRDPQRTSVTTLNPMIAAELADLDASNTVTEVDTTNNNDRSILERLFGKQS